MKKIEYDICGQVCPSTLLIALKEINENEEKLRTGEVSLLFKIDNRDAVITIPESARNMGYAVDVQKQGGAYCIEVKA